MKKKGSVLLVGLNLFLLGFIGFGVWRLRQPKPEVKSLKTGPEQFNPTPTPVPCVDYENKKYGFSLCYPETWAAPKEEEITPPQQHLYRVSLNPGCKAYLVDLYDQPAPVSLGSFVRTYFQDTVSWTGKTEIGGQPALKFFLPYQDDAGRGVAGIAFMKDKLVLAISTPLMTATDGDFKSIVDHPTLQALAGSFAWME